MCEKLFIEGAEYYANGRGAHDRPEDPLFPLLPKVLEALRARAAERAGPEAASQDEYAAMIETICGATDDSQPVEQYNGTLGVTQGFVATHQAAVGQLQWNNNLAAIYTNAGNVSGARWCSGMLISNDLFLTAGHCFDQSAGSWQLPRANGTMNIISSAEIAASMHVNFNFQVDPAGNLRAEQAFPVQQLVEYRLGSLDFAIIRLGGNPGASFGRGTIATNDAVAGDMLCIIGHPAGLPKRVEAGPALAPSGIQIRYNDIDTLGGNSGSAVLRATDGRIVGVHTNGGCGPTSPNGSGANFGQRIAAVIAASPTLTALSQPSRKFLDDSTRLAADQTTTMAAADQFGSIKFRDDVFTSATADMVTQTLRAFDQTGTLKGLDDRKTPAFDKNPATDVVKSAASDFNPVFDPGRVMGNPAVGLARPFVLATPHHSMEWQGRGALGSEANAYEAALHQTGEVIRQHEQALEQLHAEYEQLAAEYQQLSGGQG